MTAYEDQSQGSKVTVARWNGASWDTPCLGIGTAPVSGDLYMALTASGNAFVSYYATNTYQYKRYVVYCNL